MKRFAKYLATAVMIVTVGSAWGVDIPRSESAPLERRLIVTGDREPSIHRRSSDPATPKEKKEAARCIGVNQFLGMTAEEAKEYNDVTFEGVEINPDIVEHFGDFDNLLHKVLFNRCSLKNTQFSDLFYREFVIREVIIRDSVIDKNDAIKTFDHIYPWMLEKFVLPKSIENDVANVLREQYQWRNASAIVLFE